jgi:amidophosphoribosyltransferase
VESSEGEWAACFSGNLINRPLIIQQLKGSGETFDMVSDQILDISIIAKIIAKGGSLVEGLRVLARKVKGAYTLFIITKDAIYVARCPRGCWPLVIGEKKDAVIVASEPNGFFNTGFKVVRDVSPGEIVVLKNGKWRSEGTINGSNVRICSFLWVYGVFASSVIEGIPASLVRKNLGAALARRDIASGFIPDVVAPVPDSGRFHAIGYHQEFVRQLVAGRIKNAPLYDEVLLKYPYAGRSFTPSEKKVRNRVAGLKILPSGEVFPGQVLVICDDSVVRGTQTKRNLIPKARSLGFKEIHLRISNPALLSHCPWGKSTKRGEILAAKMPDQKKRAKYLGVDSLKYDDISTLVEAIGLPEDYLCLDCDKAD